MGSPVCFNRLAKLLSSVKVFLDFTANITLSCVFNDQASESDIWYWLLLQDANKRHHPLDLNTLKGHGDIVTGVCFLSNAESLATGNFWFYVFVLFEL